MGGLQIPRWLGSDPLSAWWLGLAPATLEFWVQFPNERNQGKQAHPVLKYRVPHGSQTFAVMARRRRRRCPCGHTTAVCSWGRHDPISTDTASHTHTARSLACPYSPFCWRDHSPTAFSGPMARPPPSPPRPPPSHMHAGWMVSATKTPTSSATSQDRPF